MAIRPIYIASKNNVEIVDIEFKWFHGLSVSQKQKSIVSLHEESYKYIGDIADTILEISSKSKKQLGVNLSAFNLETKTKKRGKKYTVESAFQSSKVFELGGPYKDILYTDSKSAKKDIRLKESGKLKSFEFFDEEYNISDGTVFYDWLYINVLLKNPLLCEQIIHYRVFTDIEFNPKKSLNSQAFSIALFVSLRLAKVDMSNFNNYDTFLEITRNFYTKLL